MSVPKLAFVSATLVTSSALWQAYEGTMPLETAATRFAIALVVSWIALSIVAELVFPESAPVPALSGAPASPLPTGHLAAEETERLEQDHPRPAPPTSMPNP